MGLSLFDEHTPLVINRVFTTDQGSVAVPVFSGPNMPARLNSLFATNSDNIDHSLGLIYDSSSFANSRLATVVLPAGAGFTLGIPTVDVLAAAGLSLAEIVVEYSDSLDLLIGEEISLDAEVNVTFLGGTF